MRDSQGFTLLELLIAIAIFGLLGLGTYQMLGSVVRTDSTTREQELRLRELVRGMAAFERDVQQTLARPVRAPYGNMDAAFEGGNITGEGVTVALTRTGWRNPTGVVRSRLQRVRWQLDGTTWQRHYWRVLDQAQDSQPQVQQVLDDVLSWRLRYLDQDGNWQGSWPNGMVANEESMTALPRAVELILEHRYYGSLRRLFRFPDTAIPGALGPSDDDDADVPMPELSL
ncbi:type II secretion system minor pseudopilin GspJ [Pseudomonas sp.]|jgi:general secretion pathway protein J|uniref:type II secretion system minor pseudopilin GspJ n=1 Tax=Pseudomonas sp. TaxID=306 RepID=UPI001A0048D3|nr:type II secretion system minor pseudopilin GspJ [Pseudomonas sp.]MBF0673683.1 type II secretion system minor pseudopilin GspJ [Pseudomonas sp.]